MSFAFNNSGMFYLASRAALAAGLCCTGCIATDTIEFTEEQNFPPSAISQQTAQYPLREIGQLNLDDPVETPELPLEVIVRDPNIEQTLEFRMFLNSPTPPGAEVPIASGNIDPVGTVEREETFSVPYESLLPGECNKIELLVTGEFLNLVDLRLPLEEGDIDDRTWWVEVIDGDNPSIVEGCE